ncbi:hypothetical protein BRADI_5g27710v3 [Brachypodium distachyon]|uniref:Protein kinase domain-containing protein n=1 Tax=Brachypodium distachyon TaxID=15368 RepID=A0A2K2CJR0_BRADI|nr:hypothetical protein BRADI_5g27710v3 [Brachypodium distachyon]
MSSNSTLTESLHEKTIVFGLKLWVVIGIAVGASLLGILLILVICLTIQSWISRKLGWLTNFHPNDFVVHDGLLLAIENGPVESADKEAVQLAEEDNLRHREDNNNLLGSTFCRADGCDGIQSVSLCEQPSAHAAADSAPLAGLPEFSYLGWGHWFTLRDLDVATNHFSKDNVIGEGGYGVVYRGRLSSGTPVAVKKIFNNLGQAEREFRVEVEAIGNVRHKNLVRLLGYCVEGTQRMLVYEFVNNGNLESWLHGELSQYSSLTWLARMKVLLGTAKA